MKTILVMTDFSERAERAADLAVEIAEKTGSEILLYNLYYLPAVIPAETGVYPFYEEYQVIEKTLTQKLEEAANRLRTSAKGLPVKIRYTHRPVNLGEDIFEPIDRSGIWLIVMGENARQGVLSEYFLGSITHDVLEQAFCPVLLVPINRTHLQKNFRIAFACTMEEPELTVLREVTSLARAFDAAIIVIHVSKKFSHLEREQRIRLFKNMVQEVPHLLIAYEEIEGEDVVRTLGEFTQVSQVEVLAVVHHRHSFLKEVLQRSTTRGLLNYPHAMLLVFPAPEGYAADV